MNMKAGAALGALLLAVSGSLWAQAVTSENDMDIPADLGGAESASQDTAGAAGNDESSSASLPGDLKMGLWAEAYADAKSITRDIATGEKEGYELDSVSLFSKANWWFWGTLGPRTKLDAEIGVWNGTHQLYQANSYADNVSDVTWADGLQTLAGIPFNPIEALNGGLEAGVNKLGFETEGNLAKARVGYGNLGDGGMSEFTGIFNAIDRWDDVGPGYLELLNGEALASPAPGLKLQTLAGFSKARSKYGLYSLARLDSDKGISAALTASSLTGADELFRYDEAWTNAYSLWISAEPLKGLEVALHGLAAQGKDLDPSLDTSALGASIRYTAGTYSGSLKQTVAGADAATVWGDDSTLYGGNRHTLLDQGIAVGPIQAGLRNELTLYGLSDIVDSAFLLANEPSVDLDLMDLTGLNMVLAAYGVIDAERYAEAVDSDMPLGWTVNEAGAEIAAKNFAGMQALTIDWAMSLSYGNWDAAKDRCELDKIYHSFMAAADIDSNLSAAAAALWRLNEGVKDETFVPWGFGAGVTIATDWQFLHSPSIWMNAVWGMDPFESESSSLYRLDDPDNELGRRSFLLNDVYDAVAESHIRLGMIWNF